MKYESVCMRKNCGNNIVNLCEQPVGAIVDKVSFINSVSVYPLYKNIYTNFVHIVSHRRCVEKLYKDHLYNLLMHNFPMIYYYNYILNIINNVVNKRADVSRKINNTGWQTRSLAI